MRKRGETCGRATASWSPPRATHNLWMRVTMVLKAACTSAAEQVDTMGWACSWSSSATYCTGRRGERQEHTVSEPTDRITQHSLTSCWNRKETTHLLLSKSFSLSGYRSISKVNLPNAVNISRGCWSKMLELAEVSVHAHQITK